MPLADITLAIITTHPDKQNPSFEYYFPTPSGRPLVRLDYFLSTQVRDRFADQPATLNPAQFEESLVSYLEQLGARGAVFDHLNTVANDVVYTVDPLTKKITEAVADYYVNQTLLLSWDRPMSNGKTRTEVRAVVFSAASTNHLGVVSAFPHERSVVLEEVREVLEGSDLPSNFAEEVTELYFSSIIGL
ncbi:hypothetical protein LUCX_37 [Xanthomonas phage vB_XciM_LucasX]|nr:hypothetical protein LUCX_37 [Xanthomonas phage vB_XciM_LucasX]